MSKNTIQVGHMDVSFDATRIAVDAGHMVWIDRQAGLCRTPLTNGKPEQHRQVLAQEWRDAPIALVGHHLITTDAQHRLRAHSLSDAALGKGVDMGLDVPVTALAGGQGWLYIVDGQEQLHRIAVNDGALQSQPSIVAGKWTSKHFAVSGDRICWLDGSQKMRLAAIIDGRLSPTIELLSDSWSSPIFTGIDDQLIWIDADSKFNRGKKLVGNGNYVHFRNEALSWASTNFITPVVRGPGEVGYYHSTMTVNAPTGVPYEPKHQDYWYSVEFVAEVQAEPGDWPPSYFVRAYMPSGAYFKVDDKSKVAVLKHKADAHPNGMIVEIQDT